jgi:EF hand domain-containing protein
MRAWKESDALMPPLRSALAAAAVLAMCAPAFAQAPQRGGQLFISPAGQPFRAQPGAAYPVAQWFAQADKRGDGKIDRAEFRADAEAFFHELDTNHDGVIDPFELQAYEQTVVPEILGAYRIPEGRVSGFPRGAGGPPPSRGLFGRRQQAPGDPGEASVLDGAAPYELIPDPEPVASTDFAGDGRITLAEFLRAADERFDRLDAKHTGFLTLAGLPKTVAQKDAEQAARAAAAHR